MPLFFARSIAPLTDGLVAAILFVLAANIGSFLNVVVHRLPRGESVVRGGSRCPSCGAAIRWYDNVPVLGWLWLRGRCRDCRSPISPRYPLVEAACAVVLGTVASVELITGGSNLPAGWVGSRHWGGDRLLLETDWPLVAICLLHCFLLAAALALAVFDCEGKRVPNTWVGAATLAVVVAGGLLPWLEPVAVAFPWADWPPAEVPWRGVVAAAAGIAAGWALGRCFDSRMLRSVLVILAAGLGWQAAVAIAALTILVAAARRLPESLANARLKPVHAAASDLVAAAAVQMLLWKPIHGLWGAVCRAFFTIS